MAVNTRPRNLVYLNPDKEIVNNIGDTIIDRPALMIDTQYGTVHAWGNAKSVADRYDRVTQAYIGANMPEMAYRLVYVELTGHNLEPEVTCYIMKRCAECAAAKFPSQLAEHIQAGDLEIWIQQEMARVYLDIYAQD